MKIYDAAKIPVVNIDVWHPNGIFFGADNYISGEIGGKAAGDYAKGLGKCGEVTLFNGVNPGEGDAAAQRMAGFTRRRPGSLRRHPRRPHRLRDLRCRHHRAGADQDDRLADGHPAATFILAPRSTTPAPPASPRRWPRTAATVPRSASAATRSASPRPRKASRRRRSSSAASPTSPRNIRTMSCRSASTSSTASRSRTRSISSTTSSTKVGRLRLSLSVTRPGRAASSPAIFPRRKRGVAISRNGGRGRPPSQAAIQMPEPLLELTGVSKSLRPVVALDRVDLRIGAAEAVGLIGDNGAGKSTLVKILSGLYPPTAGTIRFDGREVSFGSPSDARAAGIEMIYQDLALCGDLDVAANVFLGRERRRRFGPFRSSIGWHARGGPPGDARARHRPRAGPHRRRALRRPAPARRRRPGPPVRAAAAAPRRADGRPLQREDPRAHGPDRAAEGARRRRS